MHKLSVLLLAVVVGASSCVDDAPHADQHDAPIGAAREPGLHHGTVNPTDPLTFANNFVREHRTPCATACYTAWAGICADATLCDARDALPDDVTTCTNKVLSCRAVWNATRVFHGIALCNTLCEEGR
jgi:hypothetical protein